MPVSATLPVSDPPRGLPAERLDRDGILVDRVETLFRKWPELSSPEQEELRALWRAHLERKKHDCELRTS